MTAVETELEQAKLTISNLRDTQMRQETILKQYAEESRYYKDALARRGIELGMQRSQLLKEILKLKEEITRLQVPLQGGGGGGTVGAAGSGGGGTVGVASGASPVVTKMANEERRAVTRLQQEIKEVRREAERLMNQVNDLQGTNEELSEQVMQIQMANDEVIDAVNSELLEAKQGIVDLEEQLTAARAYNSKKSSAPIAVAPVCKKCMATVQEPLCSKCVAALQPPANPANPTPPKGAKQAWGGAAAKLRMVGRLGSMKAMGAPAKTLTLQVPGASQNSVTDAGASSTTTAALQNQTQAKPPTLKLSAAAKKKAWSFEKDIEAWRAHCDNLIAEEKEASRVKIEAKDADIAELLHASLQGRKEIYDQLADVEKNFWEPQLAQMSQNLVNMASAYAELCEELKDDLDDLRFFVAVQKVHVLNFSLCLYLCLSLCLSLSFLLFCVCLPLSPWECPARSDVDRYHAKVPWESKAEGSKKDEQYIAFIEKNHEQIRHLKKQVKREKKASNKQLREVEEEKLAVITERKNTESEMIDLRQKVMDSETKIKRLEFRISQLEGSEFKDHEKEQAARIENIRKVDYSHVQQRRATLLNNKASALKDATQTLALRKPVDEHLDELRKVFGCNFLDQDEEGEHHDPHEAAQVQDPDEAQHVHCFACTYRRHDS